MRRILLATAGGVFLAAGAAAEESMGGDPQAGREVAGNCRACHGLDGYATIPIAPHIGGEPAAYLSAQLVAFRDGAREQEMMTIVARALDDRQIADVSAWYASHVASARLAADPSDAPQACVSCHGADGIARVDDAPNLAGEAEIYIVEQLRAFRNGERRHETMNAIAAELSDEDMRAVAKWYAAVALEIARR